MQRWTLSQDSFDRFLSALDADREAAGRQYEALRTRVIKFFEWRSCPDPDSLADVAFDRVIRKVEEGDNILDIPRYMHGVAKMVFLEDSRLQTRDESIVIDFPAPFADDSGEDEHLTCLERCMKGVTAANRTLIIRYYSFDRTAKIHDRKRLADSLGMTINALRIKALRIRNKIEQCVRRCVQGE